MSEDVIYSINGPVVKVQNVVDFSMLEKVYAGRKRLIEEAISISKEATTVQVYESTTGLEPGEPVESTGSPISVALGPGILRNIFDGIEHPLKETAKESGAFVAAGSDATLLDERASWDVTIKVSIGDEVVSGQTSATFPEADLTKHHYIIPPTLYGTIVGAVEDGMYGVNQYILKMKDEKDRLHELTLVQKWPVGAARPVAGRLPISVPLITGQCTFDILFPITKGGTVAIPDGLGTRKIITQHQLVKWCDVDIIVYVGCDEHRNEIMQALEELSELIDPKSNRSLMNHTVLIANTSNMPAVVHEASIYTGPILAGYCRDMGYHVAIMADSTSHWAKTLREISGRLEEMPAEEGFPAYLPSRISQFYERTGHMKALNDQVGPVPIIGVVSPQGSNFSEPVTQNIKRFVCCFWVLGKQLAYARHYFATNWTGSYSEYVTDLTKWCNKNMDMRFLRSRQEIASSLAEEARLIKIVKLIGNDVLPEDQKLVTEIYKVVQVGYLQQNAFHKDDTYIPLQERMKMMDAILYLYKKCKGLVAQRRPASQIVASSIFDKVTKTKYNVSNDHIKLLDDHFRRINVAISQVV